MSIEDREIPEMSVDELVDYVEEDDIPTSEFTVEDTDRMVILGKLNAVLEWLKNHGYGTNIFSNGEYLEDYNIDLKLDKSTYDAYILALDDILEDIADALENIPTKTSDLINDSGFVDSSALALYQLLINASNPLSADFVNDSDTINKFVRAEDIVNWNSKQAPLTFDTTPTENSDNPVTSDGIFNALFNKTEPVFYLKSGNDSVYRFSGYNLQICIGYRDNASNNTSISFALPFAEKPIIALTQKDISSTWNDNLKSYDRTASAFKVNSGGTTSYHYIAIGTYS